MADGLSVGNVSTAGGQTRLTGTSSNLDTDAIVAAAYAAKRQPAVRLEQRISTNQARAAALGELGRCWARSRTRWRACATRPGCSAPTTTPSRASRLSSAAPAPRRPRIWSGSPSQQGGSGQLRAGGAATGHRAQARGPAARRAATRRWPTPGTAVPRSPARSSWGWPEVRKATVAVDGAMDVNDLRAAINAVSDQTGVAASVLAVSDTDRRLMLTAADTGKAIELADAGGDGITALLGATDLQAPQTARLLVDGVAVERPGNAIADVVTGVTFDLYRAEPGTVVAVKVEPSLAAAKQAIQGFVAAYNALRDFVAQAGHRERRRQGGRRRGAVRRPHPALRDADAERARRRCDAGPGSRHADHAARRGHLHGRRGPAQARRDGAGRPAARQARRGSAGVRIHAPARARASCRSMPAPTR